MRNFSLSLIVGFLFWGPFVQAADVLEIKDARIFQPLTGSNATAAYGIFQNKSDKAVTLKVISALDFAGVETHSTIEKDGLMKMEKAESFEIPAHGDLQLNPGGRHIMLFDSKKELKLNVMVPIKFTVDGKEKIFSFKVVPRVPAAPSPEHNHH